jgi:hypothetical protein
LGKEKHLICGMIFLNTARVAPEKTILHRPADRVLVKLTYEVRLNNGDINAKKSQTYWRNSPTKS